jgi:predicted acetyltransferase
MASTSSVEVIPATSGQRVVVTNLMQLYIHDLSVFADSDVDHSGLFPNQRLPGYFMSEETHRLPFLFKVDRRWAGLALVRSGDPEVQGADHDMAEFFVLRKYRMRGVGRAAAYALFDRFPGRWQIRELDANTEAQQFWRRVIPAAHEEDLWEKGPRQRFDWPQGLANRR